MADVAAVDAPNVGVVYSDASGNEGWCAWTIRVSRDDRELAHSFIVSAVQLVDALIVSVFAA